MDKVTPPPQGFDPAQIEEKLQALEINIKEYQDIANAQIVRCTIVVEARNDREQINKVFTFPPGNIPIEVLEFFESTANRLIADRMAIESGFSLFQIGNQVIELNRFIAQHTTGEIPAVDGLDVERMKNMQPGTTTVIGINNVPTKVKRIS